MCLWSVLNAINSLFVLYLYLCLLFVLFTRWWFVHPAARCCGSLWEVLAPSPVVVSCVVLLVVCLFFVLFDFDKRHVDVDERLQLNQRYATCLQCLKRVNKQTTNKPNKQTTRPPCARISSSISFRSCRGVKHSLPVFVNINWNTTKRKITKTTHKTVNTT